LEGRTFARAQAPSYFGDHDELTPFILDLLERSAEEPNADSVIGVLRYRGQLTLISARLVRGISGPAGSVVVGYAIDHDFLSRFISEWHTGLIMTQDDTVLVSTVENPAAQDSIHLAQESGIHDASSYDLQLVTNDAELFPGFWNAPFIIMMIAGFTSLGSIVLAFIFLFKTVVRPVRHLTAVAEQQVSGDLSARIRLDTRDELGRLADILNLLTSKLQYTLMAQDRIIEERSRLNAELEQRVAERTWELQQELNERKRAQADLVRAKEDAERANVSKSRFLAAASHDLRQPVHAMSLFIAQLAEQSPSRKWSAVVRNVDSCLELLREMFEKILNISKLEAGAIEPQIEDFPISRLLDRLQREFE
ncbi:MAG: histidine kinase dimerization/phospho-acceptor domain-containing protein, partial [Saprospiraceae bacterium]|nr:histidine kinase dimerization/phospho-acceptor domain-containing protein [Saprospiraceae bacterium]